MNAIKILTIHYVGVQDEIPYLVTELLQGETLRQRLAKATLDSTTVVNFALQFANALAGALPPIYWIHSGPRKNLMRHCMWLQLCDLAVKYYS